MKVIWQTKFHCDTCQKLIMGQLLCETDDESPQYEKGKELDYLRHNHQIDARVSCWKCKRLIDTHEIENFIWASNSWQDLCKKCAEDSI
jgi:hypothetical protein